MAVAAAADLYSHVEVHINEGHEFKQEVYEWLNSDMESDRKETERVRIIEFPGN
jgi:hypothetical protein